MTNERQERSDDLALVIEREFNASPKRVWNAWTNPDQLREWSAPRGFTVPRGEGDVRPGGKWRATMAKPDGTELHLGGEYRQLVEPDLLVFTHAWYDENGTPGPETVVTVTLRERDGNTAMNFRQTGFISAESRDGHAEGWGESFDKLAELLESRI